jgi:hypothetical protein
LLDKCNVAAQNERTICQEMKGGERAEEAEGKSEEGLKGFVFHYKD